MSNITPSIEAKLGKNLHNQKNHPLCLIKEKIQEYFGADFKMVDDLAPQVLTTQNFDDLLIDAKHSSRSETDTYYVDSNTVLRTHTSAHQCQLMKEEAAFLVTGDVYRKDTIDRYHYPVFHQMEGVKLMPTPEEAKTDLIATLEGLVEHLFPGCNYRINDDEFPFTTPSFEVEVEYKGNWLEILGCGIIHPDILKNQGIEGSGWAFGLGLERLAMILFKIPDIRLFWTEDPRFLKQFNNEDENIIFKSFSKYPPVKKDISMWLTAKFNLNDFSTVVREIAGDLVEEIELIDDFIHPKTNRQSQTYRITYRSMERNLTNEEIDDLQQQVIDIVPKEFGVEIR